MHLEGPWLSTTGKKRGKQKFRTAEQARKARELDESWQALQKKWQLEITSKKQQRAMAAPPLSDSYSLSTPPGRGTTAHIPSLDTGVKGAVTVKATPQYTGTKIRGIGTMHKSNAVPIFSDDEAVAIAHMRR
jgi:hypothetical protein